MSEQTFLNNAEGSVAVQVEIVDTSVTIDAGLAALLSAIDFNNNFILLTLTQQFTETTWEIVKATNIVGSVVTIERAQEGTSPAVWVINSKCEARWTEGSATRARNQVQRLLYNAQGELLLDVNGDLLLGAEV